MGCERSICLSCVKDEETGADKGTGWFGTYVDHGYTDSLANHAFYSVKRPYHNMQDAVLCPGCDPEGSAAEAMGAAEAEAAAEADPQLVAEARRLVSMLASVAALRRGADAAANAAND